MELDMLREALDTITDWFEQNGKALPWRAAPSPYQVWISEVMLQQTRIEAVIPYYYRFLEALPDVAALASCEDDRLMKLWEGLGYYSRARNLKKAAVLIRDQHGGVLPETTEELKKLPGIGDYTAGAIASIAYGRPEPAVDGNVLRVLARLAASSEDVMLPAVRKAAASALRNCYPAGKRAGLLTQGLMELGEVICIPNGRPRCESCPVQALCLAHKCGREEDYPVRTEKKPRRAEQLTVLLAERRGRFAVRKRPPDGLLAGMWEFPSFPGTMTAQEAEQAARSLGLEPVVAVPAGKGKHIFTHVEWNMIAYRVCCAESFQGAEELLWLTPEEIREQYALPTAFRRWQKEIEKE